MGKEMDISNEAARKCGWAVMELSVHMQGYRDWPMRVTGMSIRGPRVEGDEFLITVRALDAEGAAFVGFHGAYDLQDAIRGVKERVQNGTMKWRVDEWVK